MPKSQSTYGILLPIARGPIGYFNSSTDTLQQIKANFINLILTKKGERVMEPTFGCDLQKFVFEPIDGDAESKTYEAVQEAVTRWMPFLKVIDFELLSDNPDDIDRNQIRLYIKYGFTFSEEVFDEIFLEF
ncbi:MAG: GPW/gp25 family protein [Betaproteobacteria bacterium]|jgi:phage baseplate assembly protein W